MVDYLKLILKLPSSVKLLLLTKIITGVGMGMWNLNLNYFLSSKGMLSREIGMVVSVGSFSTAIFAIICGYLCDKLGFKRSMLTGCILKAGAMMLTVVATPGSILYFARIANGFGDCFIMVCEYPYITSLVEKESKNTVYSLLFSVSMLSMFFGNIIAGALFTEIKSYGVLIFISACIVSLVAVLRFFLPDMIRKKAQSIKLYLPKNKFIWFYLIYELFGYIGYFLAYSMVNLICRDFLGMQESMVGIVIGAMTLTSGIAVFIVPVLTTRFERSKINCIILILLCFLYLAMSLSFGRIYLLLVIITALMQCMMAGLIDGPILCKIPDEEKGGFSGIRVLVFNG
jgi:predicted MFS family arabinose efflux permease